MDFSRQSSEFRVQGTVDAVRCLFLLGLVLISFTGVQAQRGQEIPPFLQEAKAPQRVELEGRTYVVPDFSIAPDLGLGSDYISGIPVGLQVRRETTEGYSVDIRWYRNVFLATEFYHSTPNPLLVTEGLGRTPNAPVFDFTKSAPHLAFFCRLEINEAKGGVIPARFRLGGHRYWQDELRRRE